MPRVKRSVVEANALRLLAYLDACASGRPREAVVPLRAMVRELQLSHARVRYLVRALADREYIEVKHRFAEDGGGRPNAHRITRLGATALKEGRIDLRTPEQLAAENGVWTMSLRTDGKRESRTSDREQEQETSWQSHR